MSRADAATTVLVFVLMLRKLGISRTFATKAWNLAWRA